MSTFIREKERRRQNCRRRSQVVDKTNGFRQVDESFGQAFSKACADPTRVRWSRSAEREIPLSAFLFDNQTREAICGELASLFSFAPTVSKKKWLTSLCNLTNCAPLVYTLRAPPAELPAALFLNHILNLCFRSSRQCADPQQIRNSWCIRCNEPQPLPPGCPKPLPLYQHIRSADPGHGYPIHMHW